ncbi:hypothetical protein [Streptomyces sp. MAR25Y5]|uniref:hypothetical protein n=1 Tax=Streptomyces sp. MAR25Y5 TaxID=2962028 RepID=UPI0020B7D0A7|nr:hypothetical protein [Streptomyces sp. MAR25Y5]MCP3765326.1 hypothetical protein [Streptomyces sp. MAR25Y5]
MLESKRVAAAAGLLGGVVLIGAGVVQAVGVEGSGNCVGDARGGIRCEQVREHRLPADLQGKVRYIGRQEQTCSGSGAEVPCANGTLLGGERA